MFTKINEFLLKKVISNWENTEDTNVRASYGYLEGWVSIVWNVLLAVLKLICGILINSVSLLADAFHTFSDVLTSAAVIIGFKISKKPHDSEHPFGHGRAEYIATFVVATLLIFVSFEFFKQSIDKIHNPEVVRYNGFVFAVMLFSALIKEWLYNFACFLGKKINSNTLIADGWHHRSDAIASLIIGITLVATQYGYTIIDAIMGMVVSALVFYTGISMIKECSSEIIGRAPSNEYIGEIRDVVFKVEGVKNIHNVEIHQYGQNKYVNIHIEVDSMLSVAQSHEIANVVESNLNCELNVHPLVHVDPYRG